MPSAKIYSEKSSKKSSEKPLSQKTLKEINRKHLGNTANFVLNPTEYKRPIEHVHHGGKTRKHKYRKNKTNKYNHNKSYKYKKYHNN